MPYARLHFPVSQEPCCTSLGQLQKSSHWGHSYDINPRGDYRSSPAERPGPPSSLCSSHACPWSSHHPCRTLGHTKGSPGHWELASRGGRSSPCCCSSLKVHCRFTLRTTSASPPQFAPTLPPMEATGPSPACPSSSEALCHWKRELHSGHLHCEPSTVSEPKEGRRQRGCFGGNTKDRAKAPVGPSGHLSEPRPCRVYAVNQVLICFTSTRWQPSRHRLPAAVTCRFHLGRSEGEKTMYDLFCLLSVEKPVKISALTLPKSLCSSELTGSS